MVRMVECTRCGRRYRGFGTWIAVLEAGVMVGVMCPGCQTPDEHTEAAINASTLEYGRLADGRVVVRPKHG